MKTVNQLSLGIILLLSSCSIEKLVTENTAVTSSIKQQNDTIINRLQQFNRDVNEAAGRPTSPELQNLTKTSFENFYFGTIVKEERLEQKGDWVKLRLTEKVAEQNGKPVLRTRTGWYSYNTPGIVYLVTETGANTRVADMAEVGRTPMHTASEYTNIKATTKTDLQDQKTLDEWLAHKAMNFDGLRFDNKRFDYVDLSQGSFRGTYFMNPTLTGIVAKRSVFTGDNDFFETRIEGGTNKDWYFSYWKFADVNLYNTTVENARFENCRFTAEKPSLFAFNNVVFKNTSFINTTDGYIRGISQTKTTYDGCNFQDVKLYNTVSFETKYTNCNFYNNNWQGLSFSGPANKITGGFFSKLYIYGGDFSRMTVEQLGLVKSKFSAPEIVSSFFNDATINAWFSDSFKIYGGGDFSRINFTQSIFENGTFGNTSQPVLFNMQNCNFSSCEFRGTVKFIKCDLRGATFPASIPNVEFIDCRRS